MKLFQVAVAALFTLVVGCTSPASVGFDGPMVGERHSGDDTAADGGGTDADNDGHDSEATGGDDCDDDDATIHPGAADIQDDGIDQDCSGDDWHSESDADTDADADSDTDADADADSDADADVDPSDADTDGDGYTVTEGDCDNDDATVHPGAEEEYNDVDDDCDGVFDNGFLLVGIYASYDTVVALDYEFVWNLADIATIESGYWEDSGGNADVQEDGWAWWVLDVGSEDLEAFRWDVDLYGGNNLCEGYESTAAIRTAAIIEYNGVDYDVVPYSFRWTYGGYEYTGCSGVSYF